MNPLQADNVPVIEGLGLEKIVISSVDEAQGLFAIVHLKTDDAPIVKPVTPEVADVGVVIVAGPEITDHEPVPTPGIFADNVAVVWLQRLWSIPAFAALGGSLTVIRRIAELRDAQTPL